MNITKTLHSISTLFKQNVYLKYFPRSLSSQSSMNVFDRQAKILQKQRQAKLPNNKVYDYLKNEVGWRITDRVLDIKRQPSRPFDSVLEIGSSKKHLDHEMMDDNVLSIIHCDNCFELLSTAPTFSPTIPYNCAVIDEEKIPFREASFDLVLSNLSMHWVNDLPGAFKQVYRVLQDDGCFMGSLLGGDTLHELRISLSLADLERKGGFRPHISPFTSAQDLGSLLHQAGFVMLTLDVDDITINYPSMIELMLDLKGMGENGCAWNRSINLNKDVITAACAIYREKYGVMNEEIGDITVPALFQVINFIAWKPHKDQLKPAKRGSGSVSMKDVGKVDALINQVNKLKEEATKTTDEQVQRSVEEVEKSLNKIINNTNEDKNK